MRRSRGIVWVLAAALVAAFCAGSAAWAADDQMKIGVVDVEKLYRDAPRIKQHMEELEKFAQTLRLKLETRGQNTMLNEAEIKELIDLKTKQSPTEADKARIKTLEDTERTRDEELKNLQEKKDLSPDDSARLKELQAMQSKSKDAASAIARDYQEQYDAKTQDTQTQSIADMREAITTVGKDKGYALVFDKAAVFFGGTDITDQVIAKLDRKVQ